MSDEKLLTVAKKRFKAALEAEEKNRVAFNEDLKFEAGEQWPSKVLRERDLDGRPSLVLNQLPKFTRQIVNSVKQNPPSIKVIGVDSQSDETTAEVLTGILRNIQVQSTADVAYTTAVAFAARGGWGVIYVETDYLDDTSFEQELFIRRERNPLRWYFDPDAKGVAKEDAKWAFCTDLVDREVAAKDWGDDVADWDGDGEDDAHWRDGDKVRIAKYWVVEEKPITIVQLTNGAVLRESDFTDELAATGLAIRAKRKTSIKSVKCYTLSGGKVLATTEWKGKYLPVAFVSGEELLVDGEPVYKGIVRDAKDPQRMLNYWRSAATEKVALEPKAPWLIAEGQIDGYEQEWQDANERTLPYLVYKPLPGATPPQRQAFTGNAAPMLEQSLAAAQDLKDITGIHDASLGARSNETSGIAIRQRQQQGDNATYHFGDNLRHAVAHVGRVLVDMIPHVYDAERVVRIVGADDTTTLQRINADYPQPGEDKDPVDVRVGKYDIVVGTGPTFQTQKQEAVESMTGMVQANPQLMGVIGDLLVKNMDWPGADQMAKRLKAMLPPPIAALEQQQGGNGQPEVPPQVQMQMQQQMQQMQQMGQQLQQLQAALAQAKGVIDTKQLELAKARDEAQARQAELAAQERIRNIELEIARVKASAEELRVNMERARVLREDLAGEQEDAQSEADDVLEDQKLDAIFATVQQVAQQVAVIVPAVANLTGPRAIVNGPDGMPMGVRYQDGTEHHLVHGEDGNPVGIAPANLQ